MDAIEFKYCFKLNDHRQEIIDIEIDAQKLELITTYCKELPVWIKLDFHKCPHCPLNSSQHPNCPAALSIVNIVNRFESVLSCDSIDLEVVMKNRRVVSHTTAQKGISSLLGLLFPTSGCPHTAFFKPMVRFHLPFATEEDTIFRATGMYLLAQYFKISEGRQSDLKLCGLKKIYNNLHILNVHFAERLRDATQTDSSINALVLLDLLTYTSNFSIEDGLKEIKYMFSAYL